MVKKVMIRVTRNLYIIKSGKSQSWVFRYSFQGKRHDLGLGSLARVTVGKAEALADEMRDKLARGINPKIERSRRQPSTPAFKAVAAEYLERTLPALKSPKTRQHWQNSLAAYVYPKIGKMPVSLIRPQDVARCLSPIWVSHRETSKKLRSRIERIMNAAKAAGHFTGDNPASLGVLESLLPQRPRHIVAHHSAMPWKDIPAFMAALAGKEATSARALEWTILNAVRTSDTLQAQWIEIDGALWTIPADRTKQGKPHRVPLSRQALALLAALPRGEYLFANDKGLPFSNMAMQKLLKGIAPGFVVHGFRSTVRDWMAENGVQHDVAESALGHATAKSATVAAYLRTDQLQARKIVMQKWADFILPRARVEKPKAPRIRRSSWMA